jgi:hypothetical protein
MVSLSNHEGVRTDDRAALHGSSPDKLGMKKLTMKRSTSRAVGIGPHRSIAMP